jgi:predicted ATPase/class 3 adenylate cyclase/DNA-binding CsgD family transcriptional regulator
MIDRVGQRLGNYRLLRLLGRGNFAEVYLGEHLHLGTQAAIKVLLHVHFTSENSEQLRTEARLIARLAHPLILRILDFVVEDDIPFLIMEYAPGGTLRQHYPRGTPVPPDTIISYVKQLAEALHYIHEQGWVHRDIKPENMLLGRNNEVLLTDFGLVIPTKRSYSQQTQEIIGTIAYMAPEQIRGHSGPASDQYALGIVAYEWLSGDTPFHGSFLEITEQHLSAPPPSLRARVPAISPGVEQVVLKALAKDPQQRFANVKAFALALEEAFNAESPGRILPVASSEHPAGYGQKGSSLGNFPTGTVTLLFTDIEGSTHLFQQLGDRYASVLAECRHLLRATFQEWNGHEVDTQGDSFFVAFARATDAVLAAVEAQRALAAHPWPEGVAVRVRTGLHTGEPARTSEGYVGLDVHRAARIMSAAHGGQVLLSQATCILVEQDLPEDLSLRDLGEHRLKDLGRPRRLFQLVIPDLPADFPALKTLDTYPNNLPMQHTPFIGREQELAAVEQLMHREDVRLVTLTGPGGTGKTRLGVQVAAELTDSFADGVFFVNLAPVNDTALVVPTIAETLGVREAGGQPLRERLKGELQQKQMLLLLDNFEQVMSAAVQVVDLLTACPKLKVLVTSREALHVRAEQEFTVPPLPLPDLKHLPDLAALSHNAAVALFVSRAQAVKPDFQVTNANMRAIVEICARLDGLPLAIELAAARMKLFSPQALLARLSQRLAVLTSGARDAPVRQQTLRNTIEWSYNLLDPAEQRLFRLFSVFVGGCILQAVEAVCAALDDGGAAGQVVDGVASLIDKSLLQQTEQEGAELGLVMLETIREYGLEALAANGELEAVRQVHAAYFLSLAEQAEPELVGPQQVEWLERLEGEHDNLRAALGWALDPVPDEEVGQRRELALRLAGALHQFWQSHTHLIEGWSFLERAVAAGAEAAPALRAKALIVAADVAAVSDMVAGKSDFRTTRMLAEEALGLCRQLGDQAGIAFCLFLLGAAAAHGSEYVQAHSQLEESVALFRAVGNKDRLGWSLQKIGNLEEMQGGYVKAYARYEEALVSFREQGQKHGIGMTLLLLAGVNHGQLGNRATARAQVAEAFPLLREIGNIWVLAWALCLSAEIELLDQGNISQAGLQAEEALALYKGLNHKGSMAEALLYLARVEARQEHYPAAHSLIEESLSLAREVDAKWNIPFCLEALAEVVAAQGEGIWTTRLLGASEFLRESYRSPLPPAYRAGYERVVAAARAHLGEQTFAAAWAEGRTMTPEQVLAAQESATISMPTPTEPSSTSPNKPVITYPNDLTAREVEVLRLLAQGLTDAQIAEHLVISPRTVNTHLTSIYGKLQVSSRSAATRYAVEHELV